MLIDNRLQYVSHDRPHTQAKLVRSKMLFTHGGGAFGFTSCTWWLEEHFFSFELIRSDSTLNNSLQRKHFARQQPQRLCLDASRPTNLFAIYLIYLYCCTYVYMYVSLRKRSYHEFVQQEMDVLEFQWI